ncbi:MAG TPA: WYL domain-containing protein, partial [Sulfuricurvum sp.]|nr:WYL domain-containing protein [Sulfuricurvum sp.]
LHVHHKVPISECGNHKSANLEVICEKCHMKEHGVDEFSKTKDTFTGEKRIQNTDIIKKAILSRASIQFSYKNFDGEASKREIDPHEIIMVKNTRCVRGYCHLRKEDRSFAIKRIRGLKLYTGV